MKKALGQSFIFIGTVIGAGFATGREIVMFFGKLNFISVLIAGFFISFFCYCFLRLGSKFNDVFDAFGKFKKPVKIFILFANLSVFCATLAGSEEVIYNLFGIHGGSIITVAVVLLIVIFGLKAIRWANLLIVPAIIIIIGFIFFKDSEYEINGKLSFLFPFAYASMNLSTGGFIIAKNANNFSKKDCIVCSVISGIVLTVLMFFVFCIVRNDNSSMPFINKSALLGYGKIANSVLYLAMLTTLIGTLDVSSGGNKYLIIIFATIGLCVSPFGFDGIVSTLYPVLGWVGGSITVGVVVITAINSKSSHYYNRQFL